MAQAGWAPRGREVLCGRAAGRRPCNGRTCAGLGGLRTLQATEVIGPSGGEVAFSSGSRFNVVDVRIGELGERVGVSTRALRHYEELGLLPARRRANGYREYDEQDVALAAEIRSLVSLGFTLEDTRPFVACLQAGHATGASCADARAVHRRKLSEVDAWITRLEQVRTQIAAQLAPPRCEFMEQT